MFDNMWKGLLDGHLYKHNRVYLMSIYWKSRGRKKSFKNHKPCLINLRGSVGQNDCFVIYGRVCLNDHLCTYGTFFILL